MVTAWSLKPCDWPFHIRNVCLGSLASSVYSIGPAVRAAQASTWATCAGPVTGMVSIGASRTTSSARRPDNAASLAPFSIAVRNGCLLMVSFPCRGVGSRLMWEKAADPRPSGASPVHVIWTARPWRWALGRTYQLPWHLEPQEAQYAGEGFGELAAHGIQFRVAVHREQVRRMVEADLAVACGALGDDDAQWQVEERGRINPEASLGFHDVAREIGDRVPRIAVQLHDRAGVKGEEIYETVDRRRVGKALNRGPPRVAFHDPDSLEPVECR